MYESFKKSLKAEIVEASVTVRQKQNEARELIGCASREYRIFSEKFANEKGFTEEEVACNKEHHEKFYKFSMVLKECLGVLNTAQTTSVERRVNQLAYGFLRGRRYKEIEKSTKTHPKVFVKIVRGVSKKLFLEEKDIQLWFSCGRNIFEICASDSLAQKMFINRIEAAKRQVERTTDHLESRKVIAERTKTRKAKMIAESEERVQKAIARAKAEVEKGLKNMTLVDNQAVELEKLALYKLMTAREQLEDVNAEYEEFKRQWDEAAIEATDVPIEEFLLKL
jgi:predicted transcriptional regulator